MQVQGMPACSSSWEEGVEGGEGRGEGGRERRGGERMGRKWEGRGGRGEVEKKERGSEARGHQRGGGGKKSGGKERGSSNRGEETRGSTHLFQILNMMLRRSKDGGLLRGWQHCLEKVEESGGLVIPPH